MHLLTLPNTPFLHLWKYVSYIVGPLQDYSNSRALAMALLLSRPERSIYFICQIWKYNQIDEFCGTKLQFDTKLVNKWRSFDQ